MADVRRLIVRYIPPLRRYARALVGDHGRADDLVQDCLERAWSRVDLWRPGTDMRAWLFTIMHNLHANATRSRARAPASAPLDDDAIALHVRPAQEDGLEIRDLEKALARLPEEQRAVILLVGLEAMAYESAAAVLDIPVGTLMSRLHRGRERLRTLMSEATEPSARKMK